MASHEQVMYSLDDAEASLKDILEEADLDTFFYREGEFNPADFDSPQELHKIKITITVEEVLDANDRCTSET